MLAVVSPAKKLDFAPAAPSLDHTVPGFLDDTAELVEVAQGLSRSQLKALMQLSDKLADLNFDRFKAFSDDAEPAGAKQAVLAFSGDTYTGLDAGSLDAADLAWAQDHLRILSGLYGTLRPLDLIQPYRLEMGRKLTNGRGEDLYAFWDNTLAAALDDAVAKHPAQVVVNLASNEYFKAARPKAMASRVITPVFKEVSAGASKVIGLFAKRARGMMARYIIVNRIEDPQDLKSFTDGGYTYQADQSGENEWVFTRPKP